MFSFLKPQEGAADFFIDLGTANTLISARGQGVLVNEPTLLAVSETSPGRKKVLAIGADARDRIAKTAGHIVAVRPLKEGVIADYNTTETMLKHFLARPGMKKLFSRPRLIISLPYGVTEVEKKAVVDAGKAAGAKHVFLIDEPMATAVGAQLPIKEAKGSMIVDIGGGTTEIAVIALSDIVYCETVRIGGHKIDDSIVEYFRRKKNLVIPSETAEHLKVRLGTAVPKKDIRHAEVTGRETQSGLIKTMEVSTEDVGLAMDECLREMIQAVHRALENTPPELLSDIIESGIVLAGGGALIRDLDLRLQNEVRLPIRIAQNPLITIALGGEMILRDPELLEKIQLEL